MVFLVEMAGLFDSTIPQKFFWGKKMFLHLFFLFFSWDKNLEKHLMSRLALPPRFFFFFGLKVFVLKKNLGKNLAPSRWAYAWLPPPFPEVRWLVLNITVEIFKSLLMGASEGKRIFYIITGSREDIFMEEAAMGRQKKGGGPGRNPPSPRGEEEKTPGRGLFLGG